MKMVGAKLPKKQAVKFKPKKAWTVYTQPVAEFNIGKTCYSLEFNGEKLSVIAFNWSKKLKNGDKSGIENYRTVEV
jgi:hypothetical protein